MKLNILEEKIEYEEAFEIYKAITKDNSQALLMESRTRNLAYGKESIIATNLALKVSGKNDYFKIEVLTEQGVNLLKEFSKKDFPFANEYNQDNMGLEGRIEKSDLRNASEDERISSSGQAMFLKSIIKKFESDNKHAGLYGAISYDFARNFEDIGTKHSDEPGNDYTLFLPTELLVFDDIKETAKKYELDITGSNKPFKEKKDSLVYRDNIDGKDFISSMSENEFMDKVEYLVDEIKNGRFMQCVLSNSFKLPLKEHPLKSYEMLRKINPSPYNFFFNLGDGEFLYGASPEIHAKVEEDKYNPEYKKLTIRPLAGTIRRMGNAYDDALQRIKLLSDPKELAEHAMLVDLGRNDAYRLCESRSVEVTDMYSIEIYPNLYHLASGVNGILRKNHDSIDVLLTTIPAGTLSGAPRNEAMKAIEELEPHRRQYYGGSLGFIGFNGDLNMGITIRSVYVDKNYSKLQAGAGIVLNSIPLNEFNEIKLKMSKLKELFEVKK